MMFATLSLLAFWASDLSNVANSLTSPLEARWSASAKSMTRPYHEIAEVSEPESSCFDIRKTHQVLKPPSDLFPIDSRPAGQVKSKYGPLYKRRDKGTLPRGEISAGQVLFVFPVGFGVFF